MPLRLIKLKAIQLVKSLIFAFCLISLYFIYVQRRTLSYRMQSRSELYEFISLRKKYSNNESNDLSSFSSDDTFNKDSYFCLNKKLNCTGAKKTFCPYVPLYLGKLKKLLFLLFYKLNVLLLINFKRPTRKPPCYY